VCLNSRVAALTAERAILDTGEVIETNTVVTTVGNATHPVIKKLIDRYRLANAKGRVLTEPTLQVEGYQNLWAAGDCAAVPLGDGSMSPATAQFALRQGTPLGKNLLARRANRRLRPFRFKALGQLASLGHLNAVGDVLGFKVSGLFAWLMWRGIYLSKLPGLQRKLQVFLEWTLELIFPRDISLLDIKMTEVVGRVYLEKGDPVYDIGDPAFSFYVIEKGQVELSDKNGPVRALRRGQHFGERELLQNLKRQFKATAVEPTTLLALNKATFEALAQNSLALGYLLSRSAVEYLTLEERKAIVDQAPSALRDKRVADFMRTDPVVVRETDSLGSALKTFQEAAAFLLPVVDEAQRCKGWLRLEFAFDLLHQGKARLESPVHDLLILPFIGIKPDERVEQALLRFAQTADREFAVEDGERRLIGTLALLDLVLAEEAAEPSMQELAIR
jgi:NADH:ubiquinone reductase (H+-translocating)